MSCRDIIWADQCPNRSFGVGSATLPGVCRPCGQSALPSSRTESNRNLLSPDLRLSRDPHRSTTKSLYNGTIEHVSIDSLAICPGASPHRSPQSDLVVPVQENYGRQRSQSAHSTRFAARHIVSIDCINRGQYLVRVADRLTARPRPSIITLVPRAPGRSCHGCGTVLRVSDDGPSAH